MGQAKRLVGICQAPKCKFAPRCGARPGPKSSSFAARWICARPPRAEAAGRAGRRNGRAARLSLKRGPHSSSSPAGAQDERRDRRRQMIFLASTTKGRRPGDINCQSKQRGAPLMRRAPAANGVLSQLIEFRPLITNGLVARRPAADHSRATLAGGGGGGGKWGGGALAMPPHQGANGIFESGRSLGRPRACLRPIPCPPRPNQSRALRKHSWRRLHKVAAGWLAGWPT